MISSRAANTASACSCLARATVPASQLDRRRHWDPLLLHLRRFDNRDSLTSTVAVVVYYQVTTTASFLAFVSDHNSESLTGLNSCTRLPAFGPNATSLKCYVDCGKSACARAFAEPFSPVSPAIDRSRLCQGRIKAPRGKGT